MLNGFFEAKKLVKVILILLPILGFQFSLLYIHNRAETNHSLSPLGKCVHTLHNSGWKIKCRFSGSISHSYIENEDEFIEKEQNDLFKHIHQVCEANPQVCDQFLRE